MYCVHVTADTIQNWKPNTKHLLAFTEHKFTLIERQIDYWRCNTTNMYIDIFFDDLELRKWKTTRAMIEKLIWMPVKGSFCVQFTT